jgi:hypothetical protein
LDGSTDKIIQQMKLLNAGGKWKLEANLIALKLNFISWTFMHNS